MGLEKILDLSRNCRGIHPRSLPNACRHFSSYDLHRTRPGRPEDDPITPEVQTAADLLPLAVDSGAVGPGSGL